MIIEIDTDTESPDRLRELARFLERLSQDRAQSLPPDPEPSEGMFAMFGSDDDEPVREPAPRDDARDDFRVQPY